MNGLDAVGVPHAPTLAACGPDTDQPTARLAVRAGTEVNHLLPTEPWAGIRRGCPHPCHVRARTGGKLRSPAVTDGLPKAIRAAALAALACTWLRDEEAT